MNYSIIIPAHSEAPTIERHVTEFVRGLPESVSRVLGEIIIVENGSRDDTLGACRRLGRAFPGLIRVCSNRRASYGEAVKRGVLESRGSHLSILESDLLDAQFVDGSISLFRLDQADLIVASKLHPCSVDRRPFMRRVLTRGFNLILRTLLSYPGTDTHGLKSIEAGLAKELCRLSRTTDEVFQTEIVLLAWRLGKRILEVPIRIEERRCSPVMIVRRIPKVIGMVSQLRESLKRFPPGGRDQNIQLAAPTRAHTYTGVERNQAARH